MYFKLLNKQNQNELKNIYRSFKQSVSPDLSRFLVNMVNTRKVKLEFILKYFIRTLLHIK